ncbi:MAG: hypothetical protein B7W99_01885 [Rhodospirillales bacterium 20-58-10]|nr:MAG: hypothetical protein B7W99_01885 [Rhodospirillales bacterium 20-58-10]
MSGAAAPSIIITQAQAGPSIALYQGTSVPVIPPPSVNPLASDPSQSWTLTTVGTVSSWGELITNPLAGYVLLEDDSRILLDDGAGAVLMEL